MLHQFYFRAPQNDYSDQDCVNLKCASWYNDQKKLGSTGWDLQIVQLPMICVEQSSEEATNHDRIIVKGDSNFFSPGLLGKGHRILVNH